MRTIKIQHVRCSDWDGATYVGVPDEWADGDIEDRITVAKENYLGAIEWLRENNKPPHGLHSGYAKPNYSAFPDKTVREIEEGWAEKVEDYKAWERMQRNEYRKFENFLVEQGFEALWSMDSDFEVDWGHRHHVPLSYGTDTDDSLPVGKVVKGEEYDDEP